MGVQAELDRVAALAADFRRRIADLPFTMFPQAPANAVTALYTGDISAKAIFAELKDNYGMWICPNRRSHGGNGVSRRPYRRVDSC